MAGALSRWQKSFVFAIVALALFALGRGLLFLLYHNDFRQLAPGEVSWAFLNGIRFDAAVVARVFAIPLLLMNLSWRRLQSDKWFRFWGWSLYGLTLGLLLLLAADIVYFPQVQRHLSYELSSMGNDLGFIVDIVLREYLGVLLVLIAVALALWWMWRRILSMPTAPIRFSFLRYVAMLVVLVLTARGGFSGKVVEIIDAYGTGGFAYGNLSLNPAFTTMVFALNMRAAKHQFFSHEEALGILREKRKIQNDDYPLVQRYAANKPSGRNVVFVLLESWDFKYVDSFGAGSYGATPYFDQLAGEGIRFPNFYAAGQRSIEGIQATLTGIPPLKGLPRLDAGIGVSNITRLGSIARNHGYSTIFVQSSARDSFKVAGIAAATGFSQYYGKEDIPLLLKYPDPDAAHFGWDYDTLMFLKRRLDSARRPFLAYVFTGTTHQPYAPLPEPHHIRAHGTGTEGGYLNTLHYADWSVGQFMAAASQSPWFDNTIFIFTADHTNGLQGGELPNRFHIPLLVYAPALFEPSVNKTVGSQLDIMPTIIDLLGFDDPFAALGESLFRKKEGDAFITFGAQAIGLVDSRAYVAHNLERRVEATAAGGTVDSTYLDHLERRLLAADQLSYQLLKDNKWAPE